MAEMLEWINSEIDDHNQDSKLHDQNQCFKSRQLQPCHIQKKWQKNHQYKGKFDFDMVSVDQSLDNMENNYVVSGAVHPSSNETVR